MNLSRFFEHWSIAENPFRVEEARQDPVFTRLNDPLAGDAGEAAAAATFVTAHSDYEKIAGHFDRPSTAVVFGEKGSGKTAIRLMLETGAVAHNRANPQQRCLFVPYDDLNPMLDHFYERHSGDRKADPGEVFESFRLLDHIDAIMGTAVPVVIDELLGDEIGRGESEHADETRRAARGMSTTLKHDLLLAQALYDRPEIAPERTRALRRLLRLGAPKGRRLWTVLAIGGWLVPIGVIVFWIFGLSSSARDEHVTLLLYLTLALSALCGAACFKRYVWDNAALRALGSKVRRQIRVRPRSAASYAESFARLDPALRDPAILPVNDSDEHRYAVLSRFRRAANALGYSSMVVALDRVDEPTLISGDAERMKSVVWPLLNHKFLQQQGLGVKMLLPIELRHVLFRETSAFFQEARLDKSNLVERLSWTGAMLYDLCNARLQACRAPGAEPLNLLGLFDEDVSRQDVVDALDQMHQPRDAFKFIYQCLVEHCSNVTEEEAQWRVPRLVLETTRKSQSERVRMLSQGVRPA